MKPKEEKAQLNVVRIEDGDDVHYEYDFSGDIEVLVKGINILLLHSREEKSKHA